MKKLLLVNTKNEPSLIKSFKKVGKEKDREISVKKSKDLSFYYDRKTQKITIFHNGKKVPLTRDDYVFIRRWGPNKSSSTLLSIILDTLEIPYLDSEINTIQDVHSSKIAQTFFAPRFDVQFPSSFVCTRENVTKSLEKVSKHFTFPVVLKTMGAGRGRHVWKCDSKTALLKQIRFAKKEFDRDLYVIQEFIPNQSDIRVIVFENKIVTAIERSSNNGFYNNISQGGSGRVIKLSKEEEGIAKRAAKMAKLDLAGVDIVRTKHGPLLFEVNKAPDLKCFNPIAGFDIAEEIANRIADKY